jgi:hypothetical protein
MKRSELLTDKMYRLVQLLQEGQDVQGDIDAVQAAIEVAVELEVSKEQQDAKNRRGNSSASAGRLHGRQETAHR